MTIPVLINAKEAVFQKLMFIYVKKSVVDLINKVMVLKDMFYFNINEFFK